MEFCGVLCGLVPCLWQCYAERAPFIRDFENNLRSLSSAVDRLKSLSEEVKDKVRVEETQQMARTNQVEDWLKRVEALKTEMNEVVEMCTKELGNNCPGGCCPMNCRSMYKLGKKVVRSIPLVTMLTEEGRFDVVANPLPPPQVEEQLTDNVVVGFESKFEELWQSIQNQNHDCNVIGLVGIGGVGKTSLLKKLNNELKGTDRYDLVIWIVVSQQVNHGKIQDTIRRRLNIGDHLWDSKTGEERVLLIFKELEKKKVLLLLDDLWKRLELSEVGIPRPDRDDLSKIVFTTRSREVYGFMEANQFIEVSCLPHDQAFSLFCSKVGEDLLRSHPELSSLVEDVARECQGLPLALITIGRAMSNKTKAQEWKDAKTTLENYPSTFPHLKEEVFSKLLFSYDYLPTLQLKKCFEYCSIFPEDHDIEKEEIIKFWMAEGIIDKHDTIHDALVEGRQIIEDLIQVCLLETGEKEGNIKMHDVMRDMALWIACERGEKKNKFWVLSGDQSRNSGAHNATAEWITEVEKVSLWGSGTTSDSLIGISFCFNLVTLIIRDTQLEEVSGEVFRCLKVLQVLNLMHNHKLKGLPEEIGGLISLEYLNISYTCICRLSKEVSELKKLKYLIVDTRTIVPKGVISNLQSLQTFEQNDGTLAIESERRSMEGHMLQELEGLAHIEDLRLVINSAKGVETLLSSPKVQRRTSRLNLQPTESFPDVLDLGKGTLTKHLEMLKIRRGLMSKVIFGTPSISNNLCDVLISYCRTIQNVTSLMYAPNLCTLYVGWCSSIQEVIGEEAGEEMRSTSNVGISLFSRLTSISLLYSVNLRSICPQSALPFRSLKSMRVEKCTSLGKLPLDINTASTAHPELQIKGDAEWWDRLQWDSQATKDAFTPKYVPYE